jgi:hypothetical protein
MAGWPRVQAMGTLVLALAGGCSGQGTGPNQSTELASALDDLTVQANREGDVDAGAAFSSAAIALRLGVEPTPFALQIDGARLQYLGFVHEVPVARAVGAPDRLRTLVAVDRLERPEHVLYVATLADSADLVHPSVSLDRRAASAQLGWAAWRDLASGDLWVATAGHAGLAVTSTGGECPGVRATSQTHCQAATFEVAVEAELHRLGADRSQILTDRKDVSLRADRVDGAILSFPTP